MQACKASTYNDARQYMISSARQHVQTMQAAVCLYTYTYMYFIFIAYTKPTLIHIYVYNEFISVYSEFICIHMIACHHYVHQLHSCPYHVVNLLVCCPNAHI
jgi:hypothetical protein